MVDNKTRKYIVRNLTAYDIFERSPTISLLTPIAEDIIGYFIGYEAYAEQYNNHVFVLVQGSSYLSFILEDVKKSLAYVTDFHAQPNYHVIVFKNYYDNMVQNFIEGQYSKIYTHKQVGELFSSNPNLAKIRGVLLKTEEYRHYLEELLETQIDPDAELDSKPNLKEELCTEWMNMMKKSLTDSEKQLVTKDQSL